LRQVVTNLLRDDLLAVMEFTSMTAYVKALRIEVRRGCPRTSFFYPFEGIKQWQE
jgi:hypothetical protein